MADTLRHWVQPPAPNKQIKMKGAGECTRVISKYYAILFYFIFVGAGV
jgi:hypothetical protein